MRCIRLRDLRTVYILIGECRELGADPVVWRLHMLERLCELLGASLASISEGQPNQALVGQRVVDLGACDGSRQQFYKHWLDEHGMDSHPFFDCLLSLNRPIATRARRQLVDDDSWYGSDFGKMLFEWKLDDLLASRLIDKRGHLHLIGLHRGRGELPFSERECRLLSLFQRDLAPLADGVLASFESATIVEIAPRLLQTLLCLMQGHSEKEIAVRLGLSRNTVHDYIKKLHKHFDVSSRGELMNRCLGLYPVMKELSENRASQQLML